ncbi:MAG TPA: PKD domain-containing protein, partial [Anaerolineae bacterium]|nr:PKD domain-containing protein [Anaerolineae bacterium]
MRGITCEWPADPAISFKSTDSPVNSTYSFSAGISSGAGNLRFEWNFGDGGTALGQDKVLHIFETGRSYTVTLTVSGEPCPVTREVVVSSLITTGQTLVVPPGDEDLTYLPLLLKAEGTDLTSLAHSDSAAQVSGLQGRIEAGQTILTWEPAAGVVTAYRVYRSSRPGPAHFSPLAELPAGVTRYVDTGAACGY